ncbi:5-formyltetrahydrofolate cyclo-ligase family protein [uncultured Ruminococcus sp.]|uniref:5-formyltetrahydrofolate cyclo-ligase n=1 Tax=Massiliimalia timonensis TaxID=1987501 RepID=A0A8J6P2N2_9FIRM|nr:5-formyltetrahydrofolate cyclo-ligase [Massiliimalia timonensis]MBC8611796.1 5-formyltetrahydrofolate cyclo-ligase [Massiliimalia timonensis]MBS7175260.1 5-formyltetrahydrofolate cyclo-ligase [Clostridiales bacterium]SCH50805.1 5-formyltetrahydrofolate cyclo-ligase family protein [uncultured Clostridium sp.]SCH60437.1 5-formyltetrahydrofolate cyclo-ligase family protein [uncultured Ruminococcus sp.]
MGVDIREYKNNLRKKYRGWREALSPEEKRERDDRIFRRVIRCEAVQKADTVICFISTPIEVDTHRLIHYCWRHGKQVAVPKCLEQRGRMAFYLISSWEDVEVGKFSLLEPAPERCQKLTDMERSVCIVPGFSFDPQGYRLGFGKGYYDRFLSSYKGIKLGICYSACVAPKLPRGRFDVPVDFLLTEKYVKKI